MKHTIGRAALALTVAALALFTTAAVPGNATAPPSCGVAGMATCEKYTDAECIVSVGGETVIRDDRCDWESKGCGPE